MHRKKLSFAAAALAVASFGMLTTACQKKSADTEIADDSTAIDTAMIDKIVEGTESMLTADSIQTAEQPAPAEKTAVSTDGYKTTKSGLKYRVVKPGTGSIPTPTSIVEVNYEGKLLDGTVFDSSYDRGETIEFPLNRVIPGWTEGLQLMREGSTYEFIIPSELAYGEAGAGHLIPPNATLYFKVELVKIK